MQHEFLWGAATSSHQIEGGNIHNDWWHCEQAGFVETKEVSGQATDHWNRYREDLDIAQALGLNSYRFSIEWSRIEPKEGHWDDSALQWYDKLIRECEKRRLLPMLTLFHFTVPKWFYDRGGFANDHAAHSFHRFVRHVVKHLGSRVPYWCVLNEPMNLVLGQYIGKYMPPAKFWPEGVALATHQLLKAHVDAYDTIHKDITRRQGPWRHLPIQVGIAHNMIDFRAARKWHPMERLMVQILRRFYNRAWLDAVTGEKQHFGVQGLIPYADQVASALGRKTVDFIGVNYYTKATVRWRARGEHYEKSDFIPMGISLAEPGEVASDMGWAVHPSGLGRMLRFVRTYGLPIYITENGIADHDDSRRENYLLSHLKEIAKEIELGSDIRGYYYWSLLDNFEWIKGFGPRFGLCEINYKTMERKVRPSARFYQDVLQKHGGVKPPSIKILTGAK